MPNPRKPHSQPLHPHGPPPQQFDLVDPIWLLKALALSFAAALLFTGLTLYWIHHRKHSSPAPAPSHSSLLSLPYSLS